MTGKGPQFPQSKSDRDVLSGPCTLLTRITHVWYVVALATDDLLASLAGRLAHLKMTFSSRPNILSSVTTVSSGGQQSGRP